ncbi:MAG: methyltransferase domain-containing protein [Chloroflexi bacterium]|nr:methyltransferase domain-containing protein [Chloroflexota bacterium]
MPAADATPPICDYENSTYRTDFWEGQGREYEDLAERTALRRMLPPSGHRVIDVGAGFGRLADLYSPYEHVILLDYSHSQLVYARQRLGTERFTYVAADIYNLPLAANAVDTLVMVRVMHHLADVPRALQQIQRIMLPGGTAVLEYANKHHLKNIAKRLLGRGPDPFNRQPYEFAPLHFDFHPRWMSACLQDAGFRIQQTRSVSLFRAGFLKRSLGAKALAALDGCQQRIFAPLAISPSIFVSCVVEKPDDAALAPFDKLFLCPACRAGSLLKTASGLHCAQCGHDWPIIEGVYVFK